MSVSVLMVPTRSRDAGRSVPLEATEVESGPRAELSAALERVLAALPRDPTLVILFTGSEPLVEDVASLALADRTIPVAGAPELVAAIVERGQVPRVQSTSLGGRPAVMAAAVHAARPAARFVGVTIPGLADPAAIEGATAALRGAVDAAPDVVLVVPGDVGPGDTDVLAQVRDALGTHDAAALAALAAHHPELSGALAPFRLVLGIASARAHRFVIHAAHLEHGVLRVVGSAE
jgi:hypothetical protein